MTTYLKHQVYETEGFDLHTRIIDLSDTFNEAGFHFEADETNGLNTDLGKAGTHIFAGHYGVSGYIGPVKMSSELQMVIMYGHPETPEQVKTAALHEAAVDQLLLQLNQFQGPGKELFKQKDARIITVGHK